MPNWVSELITRIVLYLLPLVLIQAAMLWVVWDSIDGRMDDLANNQVLLSTQMLESRDQIGFLRGKLEPVNFQELGYLERNTIPRPPVGAPVTASLSVLKQSVDGMSLSDRGHFIDSCLIADGNVAIDNSFRDGGSTRGALDQRTFTCVFNVYDSKTSRETFSREYERRTGDAE